MAATGVAEYQDFLKRRYTNKKLIDQMVRKSKTWGLIDKDQGFGGDGYTDVPMILDGGQGVGGCFRAAQQNKTGGFSKRISVPRRLMYGLFSVTGEVIRASAKKDLAFLSARARNVDGILKSLTRESAIHFFRDGTGVRGRLAAGVDVSSSAALALADPNDARFFSVGMAISLTANKTAYRNPTTDDAGNTRGAVAYVIAVSEEAGTITVSATRGGAAAAINGSIAAAAASDYIVRDGDLNAVFHGLAAYIPDTAPTSGDSFMGIDRSSDPRKLAGLRYGTTGSPVTFSAANVVNFIGKLQAIESEVDVIACSPNKFSSLENELGAKKEYETLVPKGYRGSNGEAESYADMGFNGLVVKGPEGDVAVISDPFCPDNRAYGLQSDTWEFSTDGMFPALLAEDGNEILREATADAYEGRFGGYGNLICHAPGLNGVMILA